jgi:PhzF family phenazine biosynthesis protein
VKLPIHHIDAFTSRVFAGNPAAVVPMEEWLDDETLQAIAAENNLSETAFVIPRRGTSPLRWFTPTIEMDLCGHATLATAHVLFCEYFPNETTLQFGTRSGLLSATKGRGLISLDFPSRPGRPIVLDAQTAASMGASYIEALQSRDLMLVLSTESEVANFVPNLPAIEALDAFALIITAPGNDVDFVSRFFAPRAGVPEDPVTGSAHCTLVPYWAARLAKPKLSARQLSGRGGELRCELQGERVAIGGAVVEYLRGTIDVGAAR